MTLSHRLANLPSLRAFEEPRSWLPDGEALVDALIDTIENFPGDKATAEIATLAREMGVPTLDLVPTVLAYRAALLGAREGRSFYHHELRRRLPMPKELEPEVAVWQGGTTPVWSDGVLAEPKYFSFFQDAPLPAYNPNHRRKWRAHELLHGASKWFWHPEMSRFEFYVSARLNELVPIIHWYHLDEIFRPRCKKHEDQVLHRAHCLDCQKEARPFWECADLLEVERRDAALRFVESGFSHFEEEWAAIGKEIETGRRETRPRAHLDASSDAIGYMRAHWNRVTAWSFGTWSELFLRDGVDYFSTLDGLYQNVGSTMQNLVGGPIEVDEGGYQRKRCRGQLQDMGYRVLLALEFLDPESSEGRRAEETLMPYLERAGELAADLLEGSRTVEEGFEHFALSAKAFSTIAHLFPEEVNDAFLGFGYTFIDPQVFATAAVGQVYSGLEDGMPETTERLSQPFECVRDFLLDPLFQEPRRLSQRFADWLQKSGVDELRQVPALAALEGLVNGEPRQDEEATAFAVLPKYPSDLRNQEGTLRVHKTLRRGTFTSKVLATVMGETFCGDGEVGLSIVLVEGVPRVYLESEEARQILNAMEEGRDIDDWWDFTWAETLMDLLENQILIWMPAPRRGRE